MAGPYSLRSRDQDAASYAALPGTSNAAFVQHNMTPLKNKLMSDREVPGCHPSRWIYELVNNDFSACDMFQRARSAKLDSTYAWDHPHRLDINGNQSYSDSSSQVLSTICRDCHFHFVFHFVWSEAHHNELCNARQSHWPPQDDKFPWHHLVWVGSLNGKELSARHSKYYPLLTRENFVCSAPPCTFQVTLEVSEPRMPKSWVELLRDRNAIAERLKLARQEDPVRYEHASDDWVDQAPQNLNTYLKNLLESAPNEARTISKRNKRFSVLFGPRCYSIFRQLEFHEQVAIDDSGEDDGAFVPTPPAPAVGPKDTTELRTYRAYLEDVRAELECLIQKAGNSTTETPVFCSNALHTHLGCQEVHRAADSALVKTQRYKVLGILPNQPREIVVNAYKRQWDLIPNQRRLLVESLMAVAHDAGDELLSEYAITQSSVFDSQLQRQGADDDGVMTQALAFLGLQPPNNYGADIIIDAFRRKLGNDPADAGAARNMLMVIAQASTNDTYQTALLLESDSNMTLPTARSILGLDSIDVPWQMAVDVAKTKLGASKAMEESDLYLDALNAMADHTNSPALKQAVLELRQSVGTGVGDSRGAGSMQPADLTIPVGLHNIGNTCYLNSLLQYLFTVKPIRDIVLNYDDSRLELTDDAIKARLLGGNKMQMDRGEAVVAQAFVRELATLFQNLRSSDQAATRPSQRLANAVLLSTHTLLHSPKQAEEQPAATTGPPPLPARPSPAPPTKEASGDVDMVSCSVTSVAESAHGSDSSSKTLVDHEDTRSDRSYDKIETVVTMDPVGPGPKEDGQAPSGDVEMADADKDASTRLETAQEEKRDAEPESGEVETVDQKVLNALEHQKRSSGTDQQDVEEVMGSIINRLQAAIRPSSVDKRTGIQLEKIMQTFFVTTVNYTKKFADKTYQHEISFDRSITAFPAPDGPCSLYDALGRNFDQQILEESKLSRYTAIKTLPPVLHVLIQRSQSMGSKNGNPVVIPETLYMDRYMDAPHDSPVFRRRLEDWTSTDRIADLKSWLAKDEVDPTYMTFFDTMMNERMDSGEGGVGGDDKQESAAATEETWDFDGPVDDDFLLVTSTGSRGNPQLRSEKAGLPVVSVGALQPKMRAMMVRELAEREEALQQHQDDMKGISYRLHAVICHRGHLMSGHYWVWICDFEDRVWRWYNDADVRENKDTAEVLQTLSTSGEPYYLCYVRDEDKDNYVDVPKRQTAAPPPETNDCVPAADDDGDVCVVDEVHSAQNGGEAAENYRIE
ncbi:ubiquitin carboxyl-terminal hydrolase [Ophiocordyceps camponoti-floridani]|uniref:ubiquitinyl hydrolase 1 n=1 Tax=Ophiocordyceps camponoti-floridani TaxID=2030778 RepID=A0A8H4Q5C9_9HYPO|nr:ubiquitin carboxyl-terminal hydrolase [Ophiocordyceps camponoti-floridani]